jgi:hypothetical protein
MLKGSIRLGIIMNLICPVCNSTLTLSLAEKLAQKNDFFCNHCKSKLVLIRPHSEVMYFAIIFFPALGIVFTWFAPAIKFLLLTALIVVMYLYDHSRVKVQLASSIKIVESNKGLIGWVLASVPLISAVILFFIGNDLYFVILEIGFLMLALEFLNRSSLFSKNKFFSFTYIFLSLILMYVMFLGLNY